MNIIKNVPDDVKRYICLFIPTKCCMSCYKKMYLYKTYNYCSTICRFNFFIFNVKIFVEVFIYFIYILLSTYNIFSLIIYMYRI